MSEIDPRLAEILEFLNEKKVRTTYGAVAGIVGGTAQSIGGRLGARRIAASWVVNATSGQPSGYALEQKHPDLSASAIVRTTEDLERSLSSWRSTR